MYIEYGKICKLIIYFKMKNSNSNKKQIKVDKGIHREVMMEMGMCTQSKTLSTQTSH